MIELLKSGRIGTALLCELAAHPDFIEAAGRYTDLCGGYRRHTDTERECLGRCGEG